MAKDYFQDITPPDPQSARPKISPPPAPTTPKSFEAYEESGETASPAESEKSIRNIQVPMRPPRRIFEDSKEESARPPRRSGRLWLWGAVVLALFVLGVIALIALRPTTVTITPRSQTVLFDDTARFTAYPATLAASGTLSFTVETVVFEDSQVVAAQGMQRVEEKASGTITVYNDHSTSPVTLLKTTRFETPDGLIFRVPAEVVIPGKKGTTPGEMRITVIADAAGEKYNIGPITRFTLPGLKSSAMYANVYARSTEAMQGGFAGERPAAPASAVEAAKAEIRTRLEEKVAEAVRAKTDTSVTFSDLVRRTFESLPPTIEEKGGVRIHERLRVEIPVFPADMFANVVAQSVSAEAAQGGISLRFSEAFSAHSAASSSISGTPITFTLKGTGQLVWRVDGAELAGALAGRDESAFETIVQGFSGIEKARARIEPFWKKTFPSDASDISITLEEPAAPR